MHVCAPAMLDNIVDQRAQECVAAGDPNTAAINGFSDLAMEYGPMGRFVGTHVCRRAHHAVAVKYAQGHWWLLESLLDSSMKVSTVSTNRILYNDVYILTRVRPHPPCPLCQPTDADVAARLAGLNMP